MTRRPPPRHRRPAVPPAARWIGAAAGALGAAALLLAIGNTVAPHVDAQSLSVGPLPEPKPSEPARRGGPIGPLVVPVVGAEGAWEPGMGPVVVNGQPLPRAAASTPAATTATTPWSPAPVIGPADVTGSTSLTSTTFAAAATTTEASTQTTTQTTETTTATTSSTDPGDLIGDLIDDVTNPEATP